MTSDIIFVLHGASEEKYAGAVAAALAPRVALTVRMAAGERRGIQIGAAASCVIVWSEDLIAPPMTEAVLSAVAGSLASVVIATPEDLTVPERLGARCPARVARSDDAAITAEQVRAVLSREEPGPEARRSAVAPVVGGDVGVVAPTGRNMAVRSVCALVATLAVVGVAAPLVGPHASANNTDDATRESAGRPEFDEAHETADAAVPTEVNRAETPALSPVVVREPAPEATEEGATRIESTAASEPLNAAVSAVQASKPSSSAPVDGASAPVLLERAGKVRVAAVAESLGEVAPAGAGGTGKHGAVKVSTPEEAASTSGAAAAESPASD